MEKGISQIECQNVLKKKNASILHEIVVLSWIGLTPVH